MNEYLIILALSHDITFIYQCYRLWEETQRSRENPYDRGGAFIKQNKYASAIIMTAVVQNVLALWNFPLHLSQFILRLPQRRKHNPGMHINTANRAQKWMSATARLHSIGTNWDIFHYFIAWSNHSDLFLLIIISISKVKTKAYSSTNSFSI